MTNESEALVRVLASTDRKSRPFDLFQVADDIKTLIRYYGSLKKVSELVSISSGMLNQFLKVNKLSNKALSLVKSRKIDSVSIINSLSAFSENEQNIISDYIVAGKLNSLDVRLLLPLRRKMQDEPIDFLIEKLKKSKDVKVYLIKIPISETQLDDTQLTENFASVVDKINILDVSIEDNMWVIKLSDIGEKKIMKAAKSKGKSFAQFIYTLTS